MTNPVTDEQKRINDLESALRAMLTIADSDGWGERPGDHPMRGAARYHAHKLLDPDYEPNY